MLFLNHNLAEHGTYFRALHLGRELAARGHRITMWTAAPHHYYRPVSYERDGVRIVETPSWNPVLGRDEGWGPLDVAYRILRAFTEPCDLVYVFAHPPTVHWPGRLMQLLRGKPMVADWCDVYRDGIFPLREQHRRYRNESGWRITAARLAERAESGMERSILRKANGVTVISRYLEQAALETGVAAQTLLRFPSGANLDAIAPLEKSDARAALGVTHDGPLLGYVANYNPDERFFLQTLSRVFAAHPEARLLAAAPDFTPSVVAETGVGERLIMLGRRPFAEMKLVLGAADILLLPLEENVSNQGRWPNKFGDYLAAGRPIAANSIGDIPLYFGARPGSTGPDGTQADIGALASCDPEALAAAIGGLIARRAEWPMIGAAARQVAEGPLNWASLAAQVEPFLLQIAGRRG